MIKTLFKTFQIDISYSINSFIYNLKQLPIFKDLLTESSYNNTPLKIIATIVTSLKNILSFFLTKFIYFLTIYLISTEINPSYYTFIHIYFFLSLIGMFLNNKCLYPTKRRYISVILLNLDAKNLYKSELIYDILKNLLGNALFLFIFLYKTINPFSIIMLLIHTISLKIIGESLNVYFYKKKKYLLTTNTKLNLTVFLILLTLAILPIFNIIIPIKSFEIATILFIIISLFLIKYLFNINDYKLIYKNLCAKSKVIHASNERDYLYQSKVEVKEKDKEIDKTIIEKKKGYDLFNTIFFERHKELLLRSSKKCAIVLSLIYIVILGLCFYKTSFKLLISLILRYKLSLFIIIMYFINRGSVVTQAMFYNCDHAMLRYNFYREPRIILELFKKRLLTLIKINLLPSLVIALGNIVLLLTCSTSYTALTLFTTTLFIILLSVFFSLHYLVIYYLLQPYNKNMQMKKASYTFASVMTYLISYSLKDVVLSSNILSILGIIFVLIYTVVALFIVYKISPKTFKINN